MNRLFLIILAAFLACMALITGASAAELGKGVNLSNWFANAMRQPIYEKDFQEISAAGFKHVRLPVNPEEYGYPLRSNSRPTDFKLEQVDRAIALAEKYNLQIILDIHPGSDFMDTLENQSWAEKSFTEFWASVASHYKNKYNGTLVFELLNEPQYYNSEDKYNNLMKNVVAAIRKVDTSRTLIIGAPQGSSLEGLQKLNTLKDSNIIYAFHFYEPYMITHQGIHMGFENRMLRYFSKVPYPSNRATKDVRSYAPNATDALQARNELQDYKDENWDASRIASRIRIASQWASKQGGVRLICTEYGVLRNHIDADSRYRWIQDARTALESNNIAWSLWDYADLFGIVTMKGATSTDRVDGSVRLMDAETGTRSIEPAAIQALGLNRQAGVQSQNSITRQIPANSTSATSSAPASSAIVEPEPAAETDDEGDDADDAANDSEADEDEEDHSVSDTPRDHRHHSHRNRQHWDSGKPVVYP